MGNLGLIPGLGRFPGGGKGCPLQHSGLEISMDCIDCGVTKSLTQLSDSLLLCSVSTLLPGSLSPCPSSFPPLPLPPPDVVHLSSYQLVFHLPH